MLTRPFQVNFAILHDDAARQEELAETCDCRSDPENGPCRACRDFEYSTEEQFANHGRQEPRARNPHAVTLGGYIVRRCASYDQAVKAAFQLDREMDGFEHIAVVEIADQCWDDAVDAAEAEQFIDGWHAARCAHDLPATASATVRQGFAANLQAERA